MISTPALLTINQTFSEDPTLPGLLRDLYFSEPDPELRALLLRGAQEIFSECISPALEAKVRDLLARKPRAARVLCLWPR